MSVKQIRKVWEGSSSAVSGLVRQFTPLRVFFRVHLLTGSENLPDAVRSFFKKLGPYSPSSSSSRGVFNTWKQFLNGWCWEIEKRLCLGNSRRLLPVVRLRRSSFNCCGYCVAPLGPIWVHQKFSMDCEESLKYGNQRLAVDVSLLWCSSSFIILSILSAATNRLRSRLMCLIRLGFRQHRSTLRLGLGKKRQKFAQSRQNRKPIFLIEFFPSGRRNSKKTHKTRPKAVCRSKCSFSDRII